jgi:hypothetical protein
MKPVLSTSWWCLALAGPLWVATFMGGHRFPRAVLGAFTFGLTLAAVGLVTAVAVAILSPELRRPASMAAGGHAALCVLYALFAFPGSAL